MKMLCFKKTSPVSLDKWNKHKESPWLFCEHIKEVGSNMWIWGQQGQFHTISKWLKFISNMPRRGMVLHEKELKLPGIQEIARAIDTADQQAGKIQKLKVNAVEKKLARGRGKTVRPRPCPHLPKQYFPPPSLALFQEYLRPNRSTEKDSTRCRSYSRKFTQKWRRRDGACT